MKIQFAFILLFGILLFSCRHQQKAAPAIAYTARFSMLDSADIYDSMKVVHWHPTGEASEYARRLFLNAIDALANKHDAETSLPLFLQSLRIAPASSTYLKYADAIYATGDHSNAANAYRMAIYDRNNKPDAEMGLARCYVNSGWAYGGLEMLDQAMTDYPYDVDAVKADTAFRELANNEEFKLILARHNMTGADRQKVLLRMFAGNFKKEGLPYEIPDDSLQVDRGPDIDYLYADIIQGLRDGSHSFSRFVDKTYQYMAEINVSPGYHTFVYRAVYYGDPSEPDSTAPNYFYIATVDSSGQAIAAERIACYCSPINIETASIDTAGIIEVKSIKQTYKYNPLDSGYVRNEVADQQVTGRKYYRIMPDGKIESVPAPREATADAIDQVPKAPEVVQWKTKTYGESKN